MYNEISTWFENDKKKNVPCMMTLRLENGDEPYGEIIGYDNSCVIMRFDDNSKSLFQWNNILGYEYH